MPAKRESGLRRATVADVAVLEGLVQVGFDSYATFAPPGWRAPRISQTRESTLELLAHPQTWAAMALREGRAAGHVSFFPGRRRESNEDGGEWRDRPLEPGLAHLWQLFVAPAWWGRGVATQLHEAAIEEMHRRGFERARLYTPSAHARARRFYERRGWCPVDEQHIVYLGLPLTEYRLGLASAPDRSP